MCTQTETVAPHRTVLFYHSCHLMATNMDFVIPKQALLIHGGFYVRISIRNKTNRRLSTLPDIQAIYLELNGRSEYSHRRGLRSFLLYSTLQLCKFPYFLPPHRRYRLYGISPWMDLYREGTVHMVPYPLSVPGSLHSGRATETPPYLLSFPWPWKSG